VGYWMKKDEDGRWRADLLLLPRWIGLSLAIATVAIVVLLARRFDPDPPLPTWLPAAIDMAATTILVVGVVLAARWVALRRRRRVPARSQRVQK